MLAWMSLPDCLFLSKMRCISEPLVFAKGLSSHTQCGWQSEVAAPPPCQLSALTQS